MAPASITVVAGSDGFGEPLKAKAVEYLNSLPGVQVVDLGTDSFYGIAEKVAQKIATSEGGDGGEGGGVGGDPQTSSEAGEVRGLLVCGTGAGVSMVANRFKGVSAVCCDSADAAANARSINNCNVLSLSGKYTKPDAEKAIIDAWLKTDFKAPCPANDNKAWGDDILTFLDKSLPDIAAIGATSAAAASKDPCPICDLAAGRVLDTVETMPGGSWRVLRQTPTTAVVRFKAKSIEPAHHHTFSHDLIVLSGHKIVQNVTRSAHYELKPGDFLSTPAGEVHRVFYYEDTEFFIKWDGPCDILIDEDRDTAAKALAQLPGVSF